MTEQSPKIAFCGNHESGWPVLRHLLQNKIKIDCIISLSEDMAKTENISGYKSFADLAEEFSVPIYHVKKYSMKSDEDLEFFTKHKFDLMLYGGWQRLFPEAILKTLRVGCIGLHGSSEPLPKGRGRSPKNWCLIEGKTKFILHYFLLKPGVDDGDVFHTVTFDINPWDDIRTLYYKNTIATKQTYLDWIPKLLSGDFTIHPQHGEPSYFAKRTPEDGRINWQQSAEQIHNLIRATTKPYPGAFSTLSNEPITLWKAQPFDTKLKFPESEPGDIVEVFENGDFVVQCKPDLLLVTDYSAKNMQKLLVGMKLV